MTSNPRPDWDSWALGVAATVARRGDCTRRQVGAVVLDSEHRIIATGYNGAPPGGPSCLAGDCPRGRHYETRGGGGCPSPIMCACGAPWPCPDAVAPGSSYDTGPGACIAIHAEANALLWARDSLVGYTMYVTAKPCDGCMKLMQGARLGRVAWREDEVFIHSKGLT
jgi:dCMP deaminase